MIKDMYAVLIAHILSKNILEQRPNKQSPLFLSYYIKLPNRNAMSRTCVKCIVSLRVNLSGHNMNGNQKPNKMVDAYFDGFGNV